MILHLTLCEIFVSMVFQTKKELHLHFLGSGYFILSKLYFSHPVFRKAETNALL